MIGVIIVDDHQGSALEHIEYDFDADGNFEQYDIATVADANGSQIEDTLYAGTFGDDQIEAGAGNDVIFADAGDDVVHGGKGIDLIFGSLGEDLLDGGEGDDIISGGLGFDIIKGGLGDDQIDGGTGADQIDGGSGDDILLGDIGTAVRRYNDSIPLSKNNKPGVWVRDCA